MSTATSSLCKADQRRVKELFAAIDSLEDYLRYVGTMAIAAPCDRKYLEAVIAWHRWLDDGFLALVDLDTPKMRSPTRLRLVKHLAAAGELETFGDGPITHIKRKWS